MKNISAVFWALLILFSLMVLTMFSFLTVVPDGYEAVVIHNGKVFYWQPGLHAHPFLAKVRLINIGTQVSLITVNTADMSTTYSVVWQVADAQKFWTATGDDSNKVVSLLSDNLKVLASAPVISASGIEVNAVLLSGQNFTDASLKNIYQAMQGLADVIAQGIVADGTSDAAALRQQGDNSLIQIEGDAAAQAAVVVAQGQVEAAQINAPSYHQNPALFKLLVDSKAKVGN